MSIEKARALVELSRWSQARDELAPSLGDPAAGAEPWSLLGQCLLALEQPKQARDAAHRALVLDPDDVMAFRVLAMALLGCKRPHDAQDAAERAMRLAPNEPESAFLLVQTMLARKRAILACDLVEETLAAHPDSVVAHEAAVDVAMALAQWDDAERLARAGLALDPHHTQLMIALGNALLAQNKRVGAAQSFSAAVRTDPADQTGRTALGQVDLPFGTPEVVLLMSGTFTASLAGTVSWATRSFVAMAWLAPIALAAIWLDQAIRYRRTRRALSPTVADVVRRERRWRSRTLLAATVVLVIILVILTRLTGGIDVVDAAGTS